MNIKSSSGQMSSNDIKAATVDTAESVKEEAMKLGSSARQAGESVARERAEYAREQIVATTDSVESAVDNIASTLGEHSDTLGQYASEFAGTISTFNDRLKTSSLDELASDARRVARDNPAMFMLGAVTIGAIAARFFQASAPQRAISGNAESGTGVVSTPSSRPYTGGVASATATTRGYSA